MVDKCLEKWISEIVEQTDLNEERVRQAILNLIEMHGPGFGKRRAAARLAENHDVKLTDCAFLFTWRKNTLSIPLPEEQISLVLMVKVPGSEPKVLPLEMSLEERDQLFKSPGEWSTLWKNLEQQVLDQILWRPTREQEA